MFKQLAVIVLSLMLPATAWAGSMEDGKYTSNLGYTIHPPKDWQRVDAATASAMTGHVPLNINMSGLERFDVIFFPKFSNADTSMAADDERLKKNKEMLAEDSSATPLKPIVDMTDPPNFSPTISVLAMKYVPEAVNAERVVAFNEHLLETISSAATYAQDFGAESTLREYHQASDADSGATFEFNIRFRHKNRGIKVEQTLIFHKNTTYIITCTSDENEYVSPESWCKETVNSMSF